MLLQMRGKGAEQIEFFEHILIMNSAADIYEPIHEKLKSRIDPSCNPITPGTFLIPVIYYERMLNRMKDRNAHSVSKYLNYLLKKYKLEVFHKKFPQSIRVKTQYQSYGQELVRVSVRPSNSDWMILSELSQGLGISRCYLFVLLLEIDIDIRTKNVGIPIPRRAKDYREIKYAISITQIIYPGQRRCLKKLQLYELSRLRNPNVRLYPEYFYKDGSFKFRAFWK